MAKYKISFGTFPGEEHIVEVDEPTTDYGALIDILIDRLAQKGEKIASEIRMIPRNWVEMCMKMNM